MRTRRMMAMTMPALGRMYFTVMVFQYSEFTGKNKNVLNRFSAMPDQRYSGHPGRNWQGYTRLHNRPPQHPQAPLHVFIPNIVL
jgi:hypothetical protein